MDFKDDVFTSSAAVARGMTGPSHPADLEDKCLHADENLKDYMATLASHFSMSKRARRSRSDDVDAVSRLPILNDTKYKDLLGEAGAMFSVANKVDTIHKIPWIGFQSWRAAGRKVSLSSKAEQVLEETVQAQTKGDLFIYWAMMDLDQKEKELNENVNFWSMCDISNAGHCSNEYVYLLRWNYFMEHTNWSPQGKPGALSRLLGGDMSYNTEHNGPIIKLVLRQQCSASPSKCKRWATIVHLST